MNLSRLLTSLILGLSNAQILPASQTPSTTSPGEHNGSTVQALWKRKGGGGGEGGGGGGSGSVAASSQGSSTSRDEESGRSTGHVSPRRTSSTYSGGAWRRAVPYWKSGLEWLYVKPLGAVSAVGRFGGLSWGAMHAGVLRFKHAAIQGRYLENLVHFSSMFSSFAVIATSKWVDEDEDEDSRHGQARPGGNSEGWKWIFISFYVLWGASITASLRIDWCRSHQKLQNALSHIGCCAIVLYFFASILSIKTPTTVLPLCINLGLLGSLALQKISPGVKDKVFGWIGSCLGMPYQIQSEEAVDEEEMV